MHAEGGTKRSLCVPFIWTQRDIKNRTSNCYRYILAKPPRYKSFAGLTYRADTLRQELKAQIYLLIQDYFVNFVV